MSSATPSGSSYPRTMRLRAPLLITLWTLLGIEALGGLVIFFARLAWGVTPGEALHVVGGLALTLVYTIYQWQHWSRVAPFRSRLDYALGLVAAIFMAATNLTGLWLGALWWRERIVALSGVPVHYPSPLSAAHNIGSMVVLTFVGAHLGAVLMRDARARRAPR